MNGRDPQRSAWVILLVLATLRGNAQPTVEACDLSVQRVVDAFNAEDYHAMKKPLFGLGRVLVRAKSLEREFGPARKTYGKATIARITRTSAYESVVRLSLENDAHKRLFLRFIFNDRGRIEGMGFGYPALDYEPCKERVVVPMDSLTSWLDARLAQRAAHDGARALNGTVVVMQDGQPLFMRNSGVLDRATGIPLNDSTLFDLASCSKQFTAFGIILLEADGRLALTDPVEKHLPEWPYMGVTVEHLLTHTSGLPDYEELLAKHWDRSHFATNEDVLAQFVAHTPKPLFTPGEHFNYCNTGYVMLALLIERISDRSFAEFMAARVFRPLGMRHTRVYNTRRWYAERVANAALGYVLDDATQRYVLPDSLPLHQRVVYQDAITGDGTVNSCAQDLIVWERELREPTLLAPGSMQRMFDDHLLNDGRSTGYGYGFFVRNGTATEPLLYHTGGWPGYMCVIARLPRQGLSVAVLCSNSYDGITVLADEIIAFLLHE